MASAGRIRLICGCAAALALLCPQFLLAAAAARAADVAATDPQIDQAATDRSIDAWRAKRFGMFVHWGPVSLVGTEIGWSRGKEVPAEEYDQLYKKFNPTKFDADAWAQLARDAGMKYLVITSKHHDGFCLWPSKFSDYNISHSPFHRDVLQELKAACDKAGVQFCTYFSLPDWRDPDYPLGSPGGGTKKPNPNMPRFYELIRHQTRELVQNYHPDILWFDGDWEEPWNHELGSRLYVELKQQDPALIVNNRIGKSRPGVVPEGTPRQPNSGDYDTPEQRIGSFDREFPWETCMTICTSWSWKPNDQMKPLKECLQSLVQTVGGDGNFLFNVGPMPDGRIEPRQAVRLREMGQWLEKYGDGIYGTRGGPFKPGAWGASTCKGDRIFVYVMKWPVNGPLDLPPIAARVSDSRTLSGGEAHVSQDARGIHVAMPLEKRDDIATIVELTVDREAFSIEPVSVVYRSGSLAHGKRTTASNEFAGDPHYGAGAATDDDSATRWATDAGTQPVWLEVDFAEPTAIGRFLIDEPAEYQRIQQFKLQAFDGKHWRTIHSGTSIGPECSLSVDPVTVSRVRLRVLKSSDGPTIREFQVYGPTNTESVPLTN